MRWGLWLDVAKGHHQIILIDDRGWDFTVNDLLEQRFAHWDSPRLLDH
jgi:hypothetical protein